MEKEDQRAEKLQSRSTGLYSTPPVDHPKYPRKIDLVLKLNENTTVELSSSEWTYQRSPRLSNNKKFRNNSYILSLLHLIYHSSLKDVLAMDWFRNVGYLYRIEKDDQVFIAIQIDSLIISENIETVCLVKATLKSLFKLKYFIMTDTSAIFKQE